MADLSPVLHQQFFDDTGEPLANGELYAYVAGTSTPQATYSDQGGGSANTNPVVLDSAGRAAVWLDNASSYKFVLKDSEGNTVWTVDNVAGNAAADAISTAALQAGCVTTAKIADDAVTADKLKDDASTDANRAVTTNHIRNSAVTPVKISDQLKASGQRAINMGLAAATTTNANDSIKIQGSMAALSSTNILYASIIDTSSPGLLKALSLSADITIDLTGATWGYSSDLTDKTLYVYLINDDETLKVGISVDPCLDYVADTNDTSTPGSATSSEKVLVNSLLTGDSACFLAGHFKANWDELGGAANALWSVQTGFGDIAVGGARTKNRWMTKKLSADVTSDGAMSGLTFSTLVVGKVYEVKCQFLLSSNVTDTTVTVQVTHNSVVIGTVKRSSNLSEGTYSHNSVFTAAAATLTFVASSASANAFIKGNADRIESFVQLIERNDLDGNEVSDW